MIDVSKLTRPFPVNDIEWRIAQAGIGKQGPWAKVLAYITARAAQERLDEVFGPLGWQTSYTPGTFQEYCKDKDLWVSKTGMLCTLSVKVDNEWIHKTDGAQCTDFEPWKGGISDAFKRVCASGYGIGRYLYYLEETWAMCSTDKKAGGKYARLYDKENKKWITYYWDVPTEALPEWALPGGSGKPSISPIESGEW